MWVREGGGGVLKVEKGKGKVVEGVGDTVTAGGDDTHVVAAVVIKGGA